MALRAVNTLARSFVPLAGAGVVSSTNAALRLFTASNHTSTPESPGQGGGSSGGAQARGEATVTAAAARVAFTFEEPLEPLPPKAFYFEEPLNSTSLSDTETDNMRPAGAAEHSDMMDRVSLPKTFYFEEPLNSGGVSDSEIDDRTMQERIESYELMMAEKLDSRVRGGASGAVPNVGSAGLYGGPGTAAMADMVDMVGGAFGGEKGRVAKAVGDLSRGTPGPSKPRKTPSQSWPRTSLQPEGALPDTDPTVLDYCLKNRARGL